MVTREQRRVFRCVRSTIDYVSRRAKLGDIGDESTYIPVTGPYAVCLTRVPSTPYYYYTIINRERNIIYSRKGPINTLHNAVSSAVISCYILRFEQYAIPIAYFGLITKRAGKELERVYETQSA